MLTLKTATNYVSVNPLDIPNIPNSKDNNNMKFVIDSNLISTIVRAVRHNDIVFLLNISPYVTDPAPFMAVPFPSVTGKLCIQNIATGLWTIKTTEHPFYPEIINVKNNLFSEDLASAVRDKKINLFDIGDFTTVTNLIPHLNQKLLLKVLNCYRIVNNLVLTLVILHGSSNLQQLYYDLVDKSNINPKWIDIDNFKIAELRGKYGTAFVDFCICSGHIDMDKLIENTPICQ